jgi:hypothetical protein
MPTHERKQNMYGPSCHFTKEAALSTYSKVMANLIVIHRTEEVIITRGVIIIIIIIIVRIMK